MSTAYNADTYQDQQIEAPWGVAQIFARPFSFSLANTTSAAGFTTGDSLNLCPIPYKSAGYGCLVLGYNVELPSLGTTVTVQLGDTDAASNAFQATYVSGGATSGATTGITAGQAAASVLNPLMCFNATTALTPVRGVVPKQYTAAAVYTTQGSKFVTVNFTLSIVAIGTPTTTGTIKGYLLLQTLNQSAVTF